VFFITLFNIASYATPQIPLWRIEPWNVATSALAVKRSNHSAIDILYKYLYTHHLHHANVECLPLLKLNIELNPHSLFGLLCTAVLIGWGPANPPPPIPPHLGSYTRGCWSAKIDDISLWPPAFADFKKSAMRRLQTGVPLKKNNKSGALAV
jgi:hypothetical protein